MQKSTDLRYLKKILTDIEIGQVRCSSDPDRTLWSFWSCKEAACKVIRKMAGDAAFVPRRWFVSLLPDTVTDNGHCSGIASFPPDRQYAGEVQIFQGPGIPFYLHVSESFIHCIAADSREGLAQTIGAVNVLPESPDGSETDPSAFGRRCLVNHLERLSRNAAGAFEINRIKQNGVLQPPKVYLKGEPVNVDISLSHDGSFVAYAFHPRPVI